MRRLLFPVVMAVCGALLFTACANDDETGVAGDDLLREPSSPSRTSTSWPTTAPPVASPPLPFPTLAT